MSLASSYVMFSSRGTECYAYKSLQLEISLWNYHINYAHQCIDLCVFKVKDFCAENPDVDDKHAAKLLLEGGFDPDSLSWGLQLSAAEEKLDEIDGWLRKMWDESYSIEGAIEQIEKSMLNETDRKEVRWFVQEFSIN